jgi:hypothetical protein
MTKILIFCKQVLDHETVTGDTYNWREDIFSNMNIELVSKTKQEQIAVILLLNK